MAKPTNETERPGGAEAVEAIESEAPAEGTTSRGSRRLPWLAAGAVAAAIALGGLVSSALLTLIALPTIALTVEAFARWLRTVWRKSRPRRRQPAPQPTSV